MNKLQKLPTSLYRLNYCFLLLLILPLLMLEGCGNTKQDSIYGLSFSNDNKQIIFHRSKGNGRSRLHVYNLDTNKLGAYESPSYEEWIMPEYSHDGRHIVFVAVPHDGKNAYLKGMQIAIMDIDGKNMRRLTNTPDAKVYPSFSPSDKKVIFIRAGTIRKSGKTPAADYDLYEIDRATGKETRLTWFEFFLISAPYYFPDDKTFIFAAEHPKKLPGMPDDPDVIAKKRKEYKLGYKQNRIFVMQKGEKSLRPYIQLNDNSSGPLLSAKGEIFFRAQAYKPDGSGDFIQYFQYSPNGKHRRITDLKATYIDSAAISPNGKYLAVSYRVSSDLKTSKLIIYRIDDKNKREIMLPDQPSWIVNLKQEGKYR